MIKNLSSVLALAILSTSFAVFSAKGATGQPMTLRELIEKGKSSHPNAEISRWRVKAAELELARVNGEFGPRIKARAGAGPITGATGDALSSQEDRDEIGLALLSSFEFTWPVYFWGRKSTVRTAARAGQVVKEMEGRETESQLVYEIKEAFYGFLFAKSMVDFVEGHRSKLVDILEDMKTKKKNKSEIYQMQVLLSQVDSKMAEAKAGLQIAEMGLAVRTGHQLEDKLVLKDKWLQANLRERKPLAFYLDQFKGHHPKLKMIDAGIQAKSALAKSEELAQWPVLAVLAKYDYSSSSVRADQQSIFAYDPFNQNQFILGFGLEWDFQFGLHSSKRDKFLAEKNVLLAQQSLAKGGLAALVKKSWIELEKAEAQLNALRKAHKAAKKLWGRSAMSWAAGLATSKKISEAFTTRALVAKDYYQAIHSYELAWASLSQVVGKEVDPQITQK